MTYATVNPYTNELVAEFPYATDAKVDAAFDQAHTAFGQRRQRPIAERAKVLLRAASPGIAA